MDEKIKDIISRKTIHQAEGLYVIRGYIKEMKGLDVDVVLRPTLIDFNLFEIAYTVAEGYFAKKLYNQVHI